MSNAKFSLMPVSVVRDLREQLQISFRRLANYDDTSTRKQLILTGGLCLLVGCLLTAMGGYHSGFHSLNQFTPLLPAEFWSNLTYLGDTKISLCLMLLFIRRNPAIAPIILLAAVYGVIVSHGLKTLVDAARPPAVLAPDLFNLIGKAVHKNSFPSGHSLTIFVTVSLLFYFSRQSSTRAFLLLFAAAVAISRVMVGAHWPVDVMIGSALGIFSTLAAISTARCWRAGFTPFVYILVIVLLLIDSNLLFYHHGGYPLAAMLGGSIAIVVQSFFVLDLFRAQRKLVLKRGMI